MASFVQIAIFQKPWCSLHAGTVNRAWNVQSLQCKSSWAEWGVKPAGELVALPAV